MAFNKVYNNVCFTHAEEIEDRTSFLEAKCASLEEENAKLLQQLALLRGEHEATEREIWSMDFEIFQSQQEAALLREKKEEVVLLTIVVDDAGDDIPPTPTAAAAPPNQNEMELRAEQAETSPTEIRVPGNGDEILKKFRERVSFFSSPK
ncbi:hypothetical protein BSKO_10929 [Bryopsis sp. KO-2023]|nr:hypothetical protein BSKO_10929 [Bryopsis sp. KO-2023]